MRSAADASAFAASHRARGRQQDPLLAPALSLRTRPNRGVLASLPRDRHRELLGAPHPDAGVYAKKFSGKYSHKLLTGGIGHNLPQETPKAFADAIIEVDGYAK